MFLNKIDLSYFLVVFFVLCPHLRLFRTIFTRLAPFWCSAAKTDFLLAVELENSTNSLKMPQNSLRHGQLKNKKYNKAIRYTNFLKKTQNIFFLFLKNHSHSIQPLTLTVCNTTLLATKSNLHIPVVTLGTLSLTSQISPLFPR